MEHLPTFPETNHCHSYPEGKRTEIYSVGWKTWGKEPIGWSRSRWQNTLQSTWFIWL